MSKVEQDLLEILNMNNNTNGRYQYMVVEKLVLVMLEDYIKRQGKEFFGTFQPEYTQIEYDGYAPEGFDQYKGKTAIEIKYFRHGRVPATVIYDTIGRIVLNGGNIDNLVIIFIGIIPPSMKHQVINSNLNDSINVYLWDTNDFEKIVSSNQELYEKTLLNLNSILLRETITNSVNRNISLNITRRDKFIKELHEEYINDNLVLFLGAGASKEAEIATWDKLITELFVALINKELQKQKIKISEDECNKIIDALINHNNQSPLLQARLLRRGLETDFEDCIRKILYKGSKDTSSLLKEIAQLCVPNRGKTGVQAIINYNFDDLIEKNLKKIRVKYHSIYGEGMKANSDEIGIYHVHGFLPQAKGEYKNLTKSLLVFSEEGYHKLLLDPYNWANITQLNYLINNSCVFIGLSMTDPNLRRLLEIAAQKQIDGDVSCKHYAIIKRIEIDDENGTKGMMTFSKVNESLQEASYEELGVNIIWINDFSEIPDIIQKIKNGMKTNRR